MIPVNFPVYLLISTAYLFPSTQQYPLWASPRGRSVCQRLRFELCRFFCMPTTSAYRHGLFWWGHWTLILWYINELIRNWFLLIETTGLGYNGNYQPDLLITVDFDALGIPSNSTTNIALNSIQVMVRMTNDTADVLDMTRPTVLTPGVNMVGMVSMEIHQTFKNPGVATLGLFEVRIHGLKCSARWRNWPFM